MTRSRVAATVLSVAMLGGVGAFSVSDVSAQQIKRIAACDGITEARDISYLVDEIIKATNDEREKNKVGRVQFNCDLSGEGTEWGRYLLLSNNLQHDKFDLVGTYNGENLYKGNLSNLAAQGKKDNKTVAQHIVAQWMKSNSHKKNLLNEKHNFIGIGIAYSSNQDVKVVQRFSYQKPDRVD